MEQLSVALTVEQCWQEVPGGSATYILELSAALRQMPGVRAVGLAARHSSLPDPTLQPEIPVRYLGLPRVALYEAWNSLRRPAPLRQGAVDVLHATTWAIPPTKGPLVVTVHDLAFLRSPEHFTQRGNSFFDKALKIAINEADVVIAPSQITADDCVEAGIDRARIRVIPHGTSGLDLSPNAVEHFRSAHGIERDYVLWCGTLEPRKNLPTLIKAFASIADTLPHLDLVLAGPSGWGGVDEEISKIVASLGSRIHITGRLSYFELQAAYMGARAFCFPSTWEGFGLPVLEAMAHAVPVVTSSGTSMAEIVEREGKPTAGILIPPTDADAMAQALVDATTTRRDELSRASKERAGDFSWERCALDHVAAYRDAMRSRG